MNYVEKFLDGVQSALNLNASTFSGAIDVVAVEQLDGTLKSTPFHVRFGKVHILNSNEKTVYIHVNGEETGLQMRLGSQGEAYFIYPIDEANGGDVSTPQASLTTKKIVHRYTQSDPKDGRSHRIKSDQPDHQGVSSSSPLDVAAGNPGKLSENKFTRSTPDYSSILQSTSAERSMSKSFTAYPTAFAEAIPDQPASSPSAAVLIPRSSLDREPAPIMSKSLGHSSSLPKAIPTSSVKDPKVHSTSPTSIGGPLSNQGNPSKSQITEKEKGGRSWKFGVDSFFRLFQSPKKVDGNRLKAPKKETVIMSRDEVEEMEEESTEGTATEFFSHDDSEDSAEDTFEKERSEELEEATPRGKTAAKLLKEDEMENDIFGFDADEEETLTSRMPLLDPRKHSNLQQDPRTVNQALRNLEKLEQAHVKEHKVLTSSTDMERGDLKSTVRASRKLEFLNSTSSPTSPLANSAPTNLSPNSASDAASSGEPSTESPLSISNPPRRKDKRRDKDKERDEEKEKKDKEKEKERDVKASPKKVKIDSAESTLERDDEPKEERRARRKSGVGKEPQSLIELSRCGSIQFFDPECDKAKREEMFREHQIRYDDYIEMLKKDTTFLFEPEIVFKIHGRYYPWPVAGPMMVSMLAFGQPISSEALALLLDDNNIKDEESSIEERKRKKDKESKDKEKDDESKTETSRAWYNFLWSSSKKNSSTPTPSAPSDSVTSTPSMKAVSFATDDKANSTPSFSPPSTSVVSLNPSSSTPQRDAALSGKEAVMEISEEVRQIIYPEDDETLTTDSEGREKESSGRMSPRSEKSEKDVHPQYKRTLIPTSDDLKSLNLKPGPNPVTFVIRHHHEGSVEVKEELLLTSVIYLWNLNDKIVISDIDGTITRSDVFGQILPVLGQDWSQEGVAHLFTNIANNGYRILYLTARAIGQASLTKGFLQSVVQEYVGSDGVTKQMRLPDGPVFMSPDRILQSLNREVILRTPHEFKVGCLKAISDTFGPDGNPYYAGFGNRETDAVSYRAVGVNDARIFIINHFGEICTASGSLQQFTYNKLNEIVDEAFPPITAKPDVDEKYSDLQYWNDSKALRPSLADIEAELLASSSKKK